MFQGLKECLNPDEIGPNQEEIHTVAVDILFTLVEFKDPELEVHF